MDLIARNAHHFEDSARITLAAIEHLAAPLAAATELMAGALLANGKILSCGNAGSAASAAHFASALLSRFERERPELAAIALNANPTAMTAMASDYGFEQIFAKQVRALGQPGDVLLAICCSGNSANIIAAIDAAHARDMLVVALTGRSRVADNPIGNLLRGKDVHLDVPAERTARIQEVHGLSLHCLCDGIDYLLMGEDA